MNITKDFYTIKQIVSKYGLNNRQVREIIKDNGLKVMQLKKNSVIYINSQVFDDYMTNLFNHNYNNNETLGG